MNGIPVVRRVLPAPQSHFLDAVKGLSALVVLAAHTAYVFDQRASPLWGLAASGAVHAFLVVSGFSIRLSIIRHGDNYQAFALARIRRILPPFLFCIALTCGLALAAPLVFPSGSAEFIAPTTRESFSLDGLIPTLLFLNGFAGPTLSANGPLWTLSVEVWIYAAAMLAAMLTAGKKLGLLCIPVVAVLLAAGFWSLVVAWSIGALICEGWRRGLISLPSWNILLISSTARFSYTLYVSHFPLLLFLYGLSGERADAALFVGAACIAFAAWVGPWIEELQVPRLALRQTSPRL